MTGNEHKIEEAIGKLKDRFKSEEARLQLVIDREQNAPKDKKRDLHLARIGHVIVFMQQTRKDLRQVEKHLPAVWQEEASK